jgi:hypothetical protein
MSAVFLSYAREDRAFAEKVANVLAAKGHSVFWDRNIKTGEVWDEVLARELQASQRVIVLWSQHSVSSRWVKAECSEAAGRGILLPASIEKDVRIPFQFKTIQTVDLSDWDDDSDDPAIQSLLAGIEYEPGAPAPQFAPRRRTWRKIAAWSACAMAALLVVAVILMVGHKQKGWFAMKAPYHTYLQSGEGLAVGDPVLLDGTSVGKILAIELTAPFQVDHAYNVFVGFEVREPYFGLIWTDSRAKIQWHPSRQKRTFHVTRGGSSASTNLNASYKVASDTRGRAYWNDKEQAYIYVGTTGPTRWGFFLPASEASVDPEEEAKPEIQTGLTPGGAPTQSTAATSSAASTNSGESQPGSPLKSPSADTLALAAGIRSQAGSRNYLQAWNGLKSIPAEERSLQPIRELEIEVAQRWLQNASGDFNQIADEVSGTLLRASGSTNRVIAADAKAHLGHANFLQSRTGRFGLKIDDLYAEALELDPTNVYAHTFAAHWTMWKHGSREQAFNHIDAALRTGKERPFVRRFQIAMLKNASDLEVEILKALNDMRRNNETLQNEEHNSLEGSLFYFKWKQMLALGPEIISATDKLATYLWLSKDLPVLLRRRLMVAQLTEQTGDRARALELYLEVKKDPSYQSLTLKDEVEKGILRCRARGGG